MNYFQFNNFDKKILLTPIVLSFVILSVFWNWYFSAVDGQWLVDNMLNAQIHADNLGKEESEILASMMSIGFLKFSTLLGAIGSLFLTLVMLSAYLTLLCRFCLPQSKELSFSSAVNITSLASLASVSMHLLYAVYVWISPENKVNLYEVDFLSINNLFLSLQTDNTWFALSNTISMNTLLFIWCCGYLLQHRTGMSTAKSLAVFAVPYATIWLFMSVIAVL